MEPDETALSRRRLLGSLGACGLAALAGCSGGSDGTPTPGPTATETAATPTETSTTTESATPTESDDRFDARGTIEIVVDGTPVDLSAPRFQTDSTGEDAPAFHLRAASPRWYLDSNERVTVSAALGLLPRCEYNRDGWRTVTVDGTTYDEGDVATETAFFVDDALVDPAAYELSDGDAILVEITTDGAREREDDREFYDASGEIDLVVDGEPFDLSQDRFQAEHAEDEALAFHLHEGDDDWYMEGSESVTFGEGLDLLPHFSYGRQGGYHALAVDETAYDERDDGTELAFFVDGSVVNPTAWELGDGQDLLVEVGTGG